MSLEETTAVACFQFIFQVTFYVKIEECLIFNSSRDRDHGGPDGMEPDGVIEVSSMAKYKHWHCFFWL